MMRFLNGFAYYFINIGWWFAVAFCIIGGVILATSKPAESFVDWHLPIHLFEDGNKGKRAKPETKTVGHGPNVPEQLCPNVTAEVISHHYTWHTPKGGERTEIKVTLLRDRNGVTHTKKFVHLGKVGEWATIMNTRCKS